MIVIWETGGEYFKFMGVAVAGTITKIIFPVAFLDYRLG